MDKPYWYCFKCKNKFKSDYYHGYQCPFCWNDLLSYVDILGGTHDGGCGTAPDGTECGECSYGDCSICPVWKQIVADRYSKRHNGVFIVGKQKEPTEEERKASAKRIAEALKRTKKYWRK